MLSDSITATLLGGLFSFILGLIGAIPTYILLKRQSVKTRFDDVKILEEKINQISEKSDRREATWKLERAIYERRISSRDVTIVKLRMVLSRVLKGNSVLYDQLIDVGEIPRYDISESQLMKLLESLGVDKGKDAENEIEDEGDSG